MRGLPHEIDLLLIEPLDWRARNVLATIRREAPQFSIVRVKSGEQAARLMFEQGLFTREPQLPRSIVMECATARGEAREMLQRLRSSPVSRRVGLITYSGPFALLASLRSMESPEVQRRRA